MMRIIAGACRGKRLATLEGEDTRPTLERLKQALFSAIQFELSGRIALDLFAGSGQLGLEALSRGAEYCSFNDANPKAAEIVRKNVRECGMENSSKVSCADYSMCVKMIERAGKIPDLVFLDPPYHRGLAAEALRLLAPMLPAGALVAVETASDEEVDRCGLALRKEYRQGSVKMTLLIKE